eukprot:CAMPEP_0197456602 /NCGR_PEP_ID=MMETSP1175-20131217/43824_1 /TAXON_ID=1003142 /ORGANISM="Triceratium dubium, Strain CCMP147" /LENGTH=211 /DNA_ID=CAMNT_0042990723 /DNA_START=57 /DNA_END=692 /DNA_ORIENTATION=+
MSSKKLLIEVISDLADRGAGSVKRKLEKALATYRSSGGGSVEAEVIWRPYQLRPQAPPEGVPKPPDTPDNPRVGRRLKEAGEPVGINFTGKTDRSPNTLVAHALLDYTLEKAGHQKQNEVQEALFKGYFTDGVYPDVDGATSIGVSCGLDEQEVKAALTDEAGLKKVQETVYRNYNLVDGGVPFFIINGRGAFSGAQDPSTFHRVFDRLLE